MNDNELVTAGQWRSASPAGGGGGVCQGDEVSAVWNWGRVGTAVVSCAFEVFSFEYSYVDVEINT